MRLFNLNSNVDRRPRNINLRNQGLQNAKVVYFVSRPYTHTTYARNVLFVKFALVRNPNVTKAVS